MVKKEDLSHAWRVVNESVREAEERLAAAWAGFAAGRTPPPEDALLAEVARLRRECDLLLAAVLEEFDLARSAGPGSRERQHPNRQATLQ